MANYDQNGFLSGMASGIGQTGAFMGDGNSWAQGYLVGHALRPFLYMEKVREPIAYLYKNVQLPPLPEWDREKYPYAAIEYAIVGTIVLGGRMARLICSSEPILWNYTLTSECQLLGDVLYFGYSNHDVVWRLSFGMNEPYPPVDEWFKIGEAHFDERTNVSKVVTGTNLEWANHDIVRASNGNVFMYASDPIPVYEEGVSNKPVANLYNGERLPTLPGWEWNREMYPYAVITTWNDGGAHLVVARQPFRYSTYLLFGENALYVEFVYPNASGYDFLWYVQKDGISSGVVSGDNHTWANHDILKNNGSVYLKASDPVPVYE